MKTPELDDLERSDYVWVAIVIISLFAIIEFTPVLGWISTIEAHIAATYDYVVQYGLRGIFAPIFEVLGNILDLLLCGKEGCK
jgi:uncharacterized protein YqfA (UPF0365 family)